MRVKCHQCDRPAYWSFGSGAPPLCIDCAEKINHIQNTQFLKAAAMMSQAKDDMDFIMPIAPTKGRVPVAEMARAMQRGSVLNNIAVTNSNVGVLNTGDLAQIDAFISMSAGSDVAAVGEQLRALVQAVVDSNELDAEAKRETVELLKAISQQLAGDRKKSVTMSLLRSVEERAKGAAAIMQLATALGVGIGKMFGG
jgi:hypothetical protein